MRGDYLQSLVWKAKPFIKKNGSAILTGVSVVGVVSTTVAVAKGTTKASLLLAEAEAEKGSELTRTEKFVNAAPAYIPAMLIGTATIASIFGIHVLNKRQQASLTAAYALLNTTYKEYRAKVVDILGEGADEKILNEVAKDKYNEEKVVSAKDRNEETCLFFDEYRGQYFESTLEAVKDAEYHMNRKLALQDYVELNDFYILINLPETEFGATTGWSSWHSFEMYGYSWIEIRCIEDELEDGTKFYRIAWVISPEIDYLDY